MTIKEKLETIESMDINWKGDCPSEYGLLEFCGGLENRNYSCDECWIISLED